MPRLLRALIVAVLMALPLPALAQNPDEAAGAGADPNRSVAPGLERQTPVDRPLTPADVQLYIPQQDQLIGRVTIPDAKLATLVQPEGRVWREFRMGWLFWIASALILGMLAILTLFYLVRGRITIESGKSGRWVPRFGWMDRFAHWTTAASFIVLALTGLILTFGRFLLIPLIGHEAHTILADGSKYLHNFSSAAFVIGLVLMLVLWIRDNIPNRKDWIWIRTAGGLFARKAVHPEAGRFNAGQKGLFWAVILGGSAMAVTGYGLMTPFYFTGVSGMQIMHVVHAVLGYLLIAMILGHIYIGTVGMEGAFDAMGRGEVDENWAMEHHRGWYEEQRKEGLVHTHPSGHHVGAD